MMKRRNFAGMSLAFAAAGPSILRAGKPNRVIVVGAGAAGLTAAYHLVRSGVDVVVLEASGRWGGRVMRSSGFASVPLDLGAEWIHDDPTILGEMIGMGSDTLGIETLEYRPDTYKFWHKGRLRDFNLLRHAYAEVKFVKTTWYGFFERFVHTVVKDTVRLNYPVTAIELNDAGVVVHGQGGQNLDAECVLVTVPISMLQREQISFSSEAVNTRLKNLRDIEFGVGFKAFLKFQERFYPDMLLEGSRLDALSYGWNMKTYYDAAFGKPTDENILGLFTAWDNPIPRARMDNTRLLEDVLRELEEMFGAVVRRSFMSAKVQNWTREPFIAGSYSMTNEGDLEIYDILSPVEGKLFFAGEALGGDAQSTVQGAAFSAIDAVERILQT